VRTRVRSWREARWSGLRSRSRAAAGAGVVAAMLPLLGWAVPVASAGHPVRAALSPAAGPTCAERTLSGMPLAQKVGQLFMVGVDPEPTDQQLRLITRYHLGGALLAHDSNAGVVATHSRVALIQAAASSGGVRLWVAVDQEGGYVQHLKGPGFSDLPTALAQGQWAASTLRARARTWGQQLRRAGVNLNLAPVADTVSKQLGVGNRPIGYYYREYAHTPDAVSSHALAVRRGMKDAHVQTTAKHFPDLGRVHANTDTTYGVADHTTTRHGRYAVQPFRDLIHDGIPLVMVSSALYTKIDPHHIGPMSSTIMRGMLRHDMGFTGTVISDSLTTAALSHVAVDQRAQRFLRAGGDVALVGSSSAAAGMVQAVLDNARKFRTHPLIDSAALQVLETKDRQGLLPCSPKSAPAPATTH
jgi:beta-N-acetylhexosaminidase